MQIHFTILALLTGVLNLSCVDGSERDRNIIQVEIEPGKADAKSIIEFIEDIEIIPLETTNEGLIEKIFRFKSDHSYYYIQEVNNNPIKIFDKNGGFVSAVGRKGQGPGEYIQISDFLVNHDTISLFSWGGKKKWIRYSTKNDFLYETDMKFPFDAICEFKNKNYLVHVGNGTVSEESSHSLYHIDQKYKVRSRIFPKREDVDNNLGMHQTYFCQKEDEILYFRNNCDTIYSIDSDLAIEPKYRLDFGQHWYSSTFLKENYDKDPISIYNAMNKNSIAKFIMFWSTGDNLVVSYTIHQDNMDKNFLAIYADGKVYNFAVSDLYPVNKLFSPVYAGDDECFISVVDADVFLEIASSYDEGNEIARKLKEVATGVDEMDNPLLIRYKLRY